MNEEKRPTIEEMMEGKEKKQTQRRGWVGFAEGEAVNFMLANDIEKMTLDDGAGNKAKLTKLKDNSVKVECTSSNIL